MSDQIALLVSKAIFGGSILLIIGVVYREWKINKISAEQNEIALKEKQNEDAIDGASDSAIVDSLNKELSGPSNSSTKK